jgi:hypothetical protein
MFSRKVPNSRILIYKLLKLLLFYLTITFNLDFSRSHHFFYGGQNLKKTTSPVLLYFDGGGENARAIHRGCIIEDV